MDTIIQDLLKPLEALLLQLFKIVFKALEIKKGYYQSRSTETTRSNIASIVGDCI